MASAALAVTRHAGHVVVRALPAPDRMAVQLFIDLSREQPLAIDVGANHGVFAFAVAAQNPNSRIIAIEANPALIPKLARNAERYDGRVRVIHAAAAAQDGTSRFYITADDLESTTVAERATVLQVTRTVEIRAIRLDTLCQELGESVERATLKIDVEGAENEVLAGIGTALDRPHAPDLLIELLGAAILDGAIERLVARGYLVSYLAPDRGLVRVRNVEDFVPVQDLSSWNFWATKGNPQRVAVRM